MPSLAQKFSSNIRRARALKKLSQDALAQKADVSVSYVSMLERGLRSPPLETVEAFARALRVPATELLA